MVVKVLHMYARVDQDGLVLDVSIQTVLVLLTVMTTGIVMIKRIHQSAGMLYYKLEDLLF